MRPDGRIGKPVSFRELVMKDGGAILGKPDACCPHCGKEPRPFEVVTPRLGWVLMFFLPPVGCCGKNRRAA